MNIPMNFMWPQFLWLLLAVPLLVLVYLWLLRRKKKLVLRYASVAIVKQAMGRGLAWRRHLPPAGLYCCSIRLCVSSITAGGVIERLNTPQGKIELANF